MADVGPRPLFSPRGIPVRAEASLWVIAALVTWSFWSRFTTTFTGTEAIVMALVATALFLVSILAHELAHALEARRRGLAVEDITCMSSGERRGLSVRPHGLQTSSGSLWSDRGRASSSAADSGSSHMGPTAPVSVTSERWPASWGGSTFSWACSTSFQERRLTVDAYSIPLSGESRAIAPEQ
jgi:hypothetical protein